MPRLQGVRVVCYAPGMAERNESATGTQHPLAVTRTELVWEGKYDSAGNRVTPLRVALPFQSVETVNESAADRRHTLELFGQHRPSKGVMFHSEWQTYRTRQEPKLELETTHTYDALGEYTVIVKVIDILGNDMTKTVKVKVK
jgi:hypothetical protein